jgi:hypothetical protein
MAEGPQGPPPLRVNPMDPTLGLAHQIGELVETSVMIQPSLNLSRKTAKGYRMAITVHNNSGGALGTITWNAAFVFDGTARASPANGARKTVHFIYDDTSWIEIARSG